MGMNQEISRGSLKNFYGQLNVREQHYQEFEDIFLTTKMDNLTSFMIRNLKIGFSV